MRRTLFFSALLALLWVVSSPAHAGLAYPDPAGGWSYIYAADEGQDVFGGGTDFDALDGTWSHNNGSDQWDGSAPGGTFAAGENAPGGAKIYSEGGVGYLRIQDTGDPRDFGYADPGNRKIYFGHDISAHGAADDALDRGVTISFRARIPTPAKTTHPLDPLHRDGQGSAGPKPYPPTGDGYVTSDGGKGNFVIKQLNGGAFAFSLAVADDQGQGDPTSPKAGFTGLTMNEFNGNVISGNVNFGQGTGTNVLALDPTDWHEFWIVLRKDPANIGTHEALIYADGSTEARFFKITAGNGDDYSGIGYLAMGSTATPQNSALDVDFFAVKTEAVFPPGALANLPPELRDLSPARGTRYVAPSEGLRFTGITQPPNSIAATGAKLLLDGRDVSADLVASGDLRNRTFTYSKLEANKLYAGSVVLTDQAGRASTNAVSFDTFVQSQIVQTDFTDYGTTATVALPAGRHQIYLLAGATRAVTIRVDRIDGGIATSLGVLRIPNTGSLDSPQFSALSDALGAPVVVDGGRSLTLRFTPFGGAGSAPREIVVAPTTDPVTGSYFGITLPLPGANALPDAAVVAEIVRGNGSIDAGSVRVFVDGTDVTSSAAQQSTSTGLSVRYAPPAFLPANTTVQAKVRYTSSGAPREAAWSFTVVDVPRLKASWATATGSVAGKTRGFTGRIHKARNDADGALFGNSPERAENQLANRIIDPDTSEPFVNEAAGPANDGSFAEPETINYEQTGVDEGIPGDRPFPNLDAADQNNLALEVSTFLSLPRGAHRLAVACDDGFVVYAGPSAARATNQFGIRNPGGGTAEVTFDVATEIEGVFAFRLLFFEGNGGADIEWYSVNLETGARTLINADGGIRAWQSRTGDGSDNPAPTAVSLKAERAGAGLVLSWPKSATGYRLESTATLGSSSWNPVGTAPVDSGTTLSVTIPATGAPTFYRLRAP